MIAQSRAVFHHAVYVYALDFGCRDNLRHSLGLRTWISDGTTPEILSLEARVGGSGEL